MNLFFWKQKRYDKELEMYLEQSQLYPYLQEGLNIIDQVLSGEIHFVHKTDIEKKLEHCNVELWHITEDSIRLRIFTKRHDKILEIDSTEYTFFDRSFNFTLRLPVGDRDFEIMQIEKTKIYEEYRKKFIALHSPRRFKKTNNNRTKTLLKKDAHKHRLHNLLK